jgi:hypothetical protein
MERLEHEADQATAQIRARFLVHLFQRIAVEPDAAAVGRIQPGQQAEQGGLAGAGGADDGETFAGMICRLTLCRMSSFPSGPLTDLLTSRVLEARGKNHSCVDALV